MAAVEDVRMIDLKGVDGFDWAYSRAEARIECVPATLVWIMGSGSVKN